jgi:hypothetical protein
MNTYTSIILMWTSFCKHFISTISTHLFIILYLKFFSILKQLTFVISAMHVIDLLITLVIKVALSARILVWYLFRNKNFNNFNYDYIFVKTTSILHPAGFYVTKTCVSSDSCKETSITLFGLGFSTSCCRFDNCNQSEIILSNKFLITLILYFFIF